MASKTDEPPGFGTKRWFDRSFAETKAKQHAFNAWHAGLITRNQLDAIIETNSSLVVIGLTGNNSQSEKKNTLKEHSCDVRK